MIYGGLARKIATPSPDSPSRHLFTVTGQMVADLQRCLARHHLFAGLAKHVARPMSGSPTPPLSRGSAIVSMTPIVSAPGRTLYRRRAIVPALSRKQPPACIPLRAGATVVLTPKTETHQRAFSTQRATTRSAPSSAVPAAPFTNAGPTYGRYPIGQRPAFTPSKHGGQARRVNQLSTAAMHFSERRANEITPPTFRVPAAHL